MVACGSAPISGPAMEFLRVALACDLIEGALRNFFPSIVCC